MISDFLPKSFMSAVGFVSLITAPLAFIASASGAHAGTNLLGICLTTSVSTIKGSWVATVEPLMGTFMGPIVSGLPLNPAAMAIICGLGFGILNLLFMLSEYQTDFWFVINTRVIATIFLSIYAPCVSMAAGNLISAPDQVAKLASINNIAGILGGIVTPVVGGVVAQYYSWRYMFVGVGALAILHSLFLLLALPIKGMRNIPKSRFDAGSHGILVCVIILITFGLSSLRVENATPVYVSIIAIVIGALLLVFFLDYNLRMSEKPMLTSDSFQLQYILTNISIFMTEVARGLECYFAAYINLLVFKTSSNMSGLCLTLAALGVIICTPLANWANKSTDKIKALSIFSGLYMISCSIQAIQLAYARTLVLFVIMSFLKNGLHAATLIRYSPLIKSPISMIASQIKGYGFSTGVVVSVMCETMFDKQAQFLPSKFVPNFLIAALFMAGAGILIPWIGAIVPRRRSTDQEETKVDSGKIGFFAPPSF